MRDFHWLEASGEPKTAHALLARYLALNLKDDHGVSDPHVNHLLRAGWKREALAICSRFPDNFLVKIPLEAALAHYCVGEMNAGQALAEPLGGNRHVIGMLCHHA